MTERSRPLHRAARVVDAVAAAPAGVSLNELARRTALPVATVHRIATNLKEVGYLTSEGGRSPWRLGPRLLRLLRLAVPPARIAEIARPLLQHLMNRFGETAYLTRYTGEEVVLSVCSLPSTGDRGGIHPGDRFPVNATAAGKITYALQPPEVIEAALATRLERYTPKTVVDRRRVRRMLGEARTRGYACSDEEVDPGTFAVAVPLVLPGAPPLYALGVVGLRERLLGQHREEDVASALRAAAERLAAAVDAGEAQDADA
jgi:DNA-binding IclR family transcriptional regulator